ncbi:MAG: hypothetical protein LC772_07815 [Chloroflexi bacterium]|nr:hypothetical protein [Chloroflexota bacterium]
MAQNARNASMTGALREGVRAATTQYNAVRQYLEGAGALPPGFFPPLPEDASFDEVGISASQLESFLEEESDDAQDAQRAARDAERQARRAEHEARRAARRIGRFGNADADIDLGDLGDLWELKNLGQIIRDSMPEDIGRVVGMKMAQGFGDAVKWKTGPDMAPDPDAPQPPSPPDPPTPPQAPQEPHAFDQGGRESARIAEAEQRLAGAASRIEEIAQRLQSPDLEAEERTTLIQEIARLGGEQADLAREASSIRTTLIR